MRTHYPRANGAPTVIEPSPELAAALRTTRRKKTPPADAESASVGVRRPRMTPEERSAKRKAWLATQREKKAKARAAEREAEVAAKTAAMESVTKAGKPKARIVSEPPPAATPQSETTEAPTNPWPGMTMLETICATFVGAFCGAVNRYVDSVEKLNIAKARKLEVETRKLERL